MRSGARWLLVAMLWTLPGLVSTAQAYELTLAGAPHALARAALWQMTGWYFWLPATPAVLWLAARLPLERGHLARRLPLHLGLAFGVAAPHLALSAAAGRLAAVPYYGDTPFARLVAQLYAHNVHLDLVTYGGILAVGQALALARAARVRERRAAELEAAVRQGELRALKAQMQPHFLFNTLNAIAVLVRKREGERAQAALAGLGELLRMALATHDRPTVSLGHEVEFARRYLELEGLRLGDRLTVGVTVDPASLDAVLPCLVLQPLVENAVRHGLAPRAAGGRVELATEVAGRRLRITVADDGLGLPSGFALERGGGVALRNIRARLEQLYPGDHRFEITSPAEGGTRVALDLPLAYPEPHG